MSFVVSQVQEDINARNQHLAELEERDIIIAERNKVIAEREVLLEQLRGEVESVRTNKYIVVLDSFSFTFFHGFHLCAMMLVPRYACPARSSQCQQGPNHPGT
jgi:hypothetical protein